MPYPDAPAGRESYCAYEDRMAANTGCLDRILDDELRAFGAWATSLPGYSVSTEKTDIDSISLEVDSLHTALYVSGHAFEYGGAYTVTIAADTTSAAYSVYVSLYKDPTKGV